MRTKSMVYTFHTLRKRKVFHYQGRKFIYNIDSWIVKEKINALWKVTQLKFQRVIPGSWTTTNKIYVDIE